MSFVYNMNRVNKYISGSKIVLILLILTLFLPILMLVIGSRFISECNLDGTIPIWLIIGGCLLLINHCIHIAINCRELYSSCKGSNNQDTETKNSKSLLLRGIPGILIIGWLIGASVLTYPQESTVTFDDPSQPTYCPKTCFHFLFVKSIIMWVFLALLVITLIVSSIVLNRLRK